MRVLLSALILSWMVLGVATPAEAQNDIGSETSPWGLRVGLANSPDQIVFGVNFLETKVGQNLYIVPDAEFGFGNDAFVLSGVAAVHYRFVVDAKVRPYAGGGVSVSLIDYDRTNNNTTTFKVGARGTGGIIWQLKGGREMFAEMNIIFGDPYNVQAMVGWRF